MGRRREDSTTRQWLDREPPPVEFPGARADTIADAPPMCPCGSPWFGEDGALACRMCGRRLYVTSELRRVVERYGFGRVTVAA